jgi:hypothetical protein
MPVKYRGDLKRWVFDWSGVSEEVAAAHGYRGLGRAARVELSVAEAERRHQERMARLAAEKAAKLALKAARKAAARERARIRRKLYFAAYYALHRERIAARRKAQRALLRNAPG